MTRGLDRAAEKFLGALRDASIRLAAAEGLVRPRRPELVFLLLLASVALVSSSASMAPALAGLAGSAAPLAYLLLARRGGAALVLQPVAYAAAASLVVSLPLLLGGRGGEALAFVARITASAVMVSSVAGLVGWRCLAEGMHRLGAPREFTESLRLVLRYTPLLAAEALRMLAARRARSLGRRGLAEEWRLLATAVGELLTRSTQRATVLSMALEARSLSASPAGYRREARGRAEALAYLPSVAAIAALGLSLVAGH